MSKYCVLPFASIRLEDSQNVNSTRIKPCCLYTPQTTEIFDTVEQYLQSDMLKNLQNHFLTQEELPPGCSVCKTVEDQNQLSVRQLKNRFFDYHPQTTQIKELDIFPSNLCNLQCMMCGPKSSSAIGAEQKKLGLIDKIYNFDETDLVCDTLDKLDQLTHITVAGGEFFYAKHVVRILEKIVAKGIKNVKITTNGTIYNPQHLELLKQIPELNVRFSLDGTDEIYEFIRYPARWNNVVSNIKQFKLNLPNATFETVVVMQPLSVFGVFEWLEFANQMQLETHWINILTKEQLNWSMLTHDEKSTVINFLALGINQAKLDTKQKISVLNYIKNTIPSYTFDPEIRKTSINKIALLCSHRKIQQEKIEKIFKHWPILLKEIQNKLNENRNNNNPR